MNEKIIEALMQLFALIANPLRNDPERMAVVESFLSQRLNFALAKKYLEQYNKEYAEAQERLGRSSPERREGAIAIRITKLCIDINDEGQLDREQRIVVVIQALEFCKSGGADVTTLEKGFIATLADGLGIDKTEYDLIEKFVLNPFTDIPVSPNILVISGEKLNVPEQVKFVRKDQLRGQIWILFVPSINMYFLRFTWSAELSMNSQLLQDNKVYPVSRGSAIKGHNISPVYYWDITMQFLKEDFQSSGVLYEVNNLEYKFKTGDVGIHHMSFASESGRMVGIMGASGAGKSTLLSVLNGMNRPSDGEVLINGINIHKERERIKGLIGYVSQDDLLIEELTVFNNLYFNAKLCFGNLSEEEIIEKVDNVLKNLGLYEIRNMKVGSPLNKKISGGQRKRLNISLELIREPAILFLDEPTSGLSSRDSENILDLLKELTRKGKLLFVVIHQPSSDIFKMFDKLLILDTGGYLIYNGSPIDSIEYFKKKIGHPNYSESECFACGNVNPEQVFNIVETRIFSESGKPTDTRRISPSDWRLLYESERKDEKYEKSDTLPEISFRIPDKLRQFMLFAKRDILSKAADFQYLLITFLVAPLLALSLAFLIRYFDESAKDPQYTLIDNSNLPVYLFMSVIVALFMGLTISAEEIFKDKKILKREAFLNLSWNSYLMSKVSVQFGISAIQALSYVLIGNSITGVRHMTFEFWLILFSCWASANVMGLVISDSFKAIVTIYILIPFLIIPQIILSGVLVKFEKLNPNISSPVSIPLYGEFIIARWGYEALAVEQFVNNRYEKLFYPYDKKMSEARFMKDYWNSRIRVKIESLKNDLKKGTKSPEFDENLQLMSKEFKKHSQVNSSVRFAYSEFLTPDKITAGILDSALAFAESLRKYHILKYNEANNSKDEYVTRLETEDKDAFIKLRNENFNKSLEEMVTFKSETQKIIDYNNEIVQKLDPVYLDPRNKFIKAHFYSPEKRIFNLYIKTFAVNAFIIWMMTAILYLFLYLRVLKRILKSTEKLFRRGIRIND